MYKRIRIQAPAKLNLHLDVLDKREDGFHNLISLFQSVALFDTFVINVKTGSSGCSIDGDFPFPEDDNIVKKAVLAFFAECGRKRFCEIEILKRIPIGAGLGGGSSNAAAIITSLVTLFPECLPEEKIKQVLEGLGSDVPYFYYAAAGIVTGRGEEVIPLASRTDYTVVIVFPGFQIHTSAAYSWLDIERKGMRIKKRYKEKEVIHKYLNTAVDSWNFINSFKTVLFHEHPVFQSILSDFYSSGALYANITGSGSALFGLYRRENEAGAAFGYLKTKYPFVFLTKPLDKIPSPVVY